MKLEDKEKYTERKKIYRILSKNTARKNTMNMHKKSEKGNT